MTTVRHDSIFGHKTPSHTIIIARGDKVRHFTLRPWAVALSTTVASAAIAGCVGLGAYILMHDDFSASVTVQQERLHGDYEQRIASLRAQLDRAVSRQLLDRETVETKVDVLLDQQLELTERYEKLRPLLDRALSSGIIADPVADLVPVPQPQPKPSGDRAAAEPSSPVPSGTLALSLGSEPARDTLQRFAAIDRTQRPAVAPDATGWRLSASQSAGAVPKEPTVSPQLIQEIGRSIDSVEEGQLAGLFGLALSARTRAAGIASALRSEGIRVPVSEASTGPEAGSEELLGAGGPFVPLPDESAFDMRYNDLDNALVELQSLRRATQRLPLEAPVKGAAVSSTFGVRADPFLGRSALHTGIDFAAVAGTRIKAAAAGTVISAAPNGGYGNMVEIDHGGGVTTRYAHMSSIAVAEGDHVDAGDAVGSVGSTGRSTGPHLHYEIRREGTAIDPSRFLRAGRKIDALG